MRPFTTTISNRPIPAVGGAEHTWVRVRGARLHITAFGHGEPILLVHGFPQHWYAWRKVVDRLRDDYRLLCVDLRGFGWSEQTKRGYDLDGVATDLLRLLDALGLQQTGLVAHNWSAQAGFRLCLRAPERIAGHLALNTMHPWPRHRRMLPNLWRMWFTAFVEYPLVGKMVLRQWPAFTRYLLRHQVADPGVWEDADLAEFVEAAQSSAHAGQSLFWQYVVHEIPALVRSTNRQQHLAVPTLMLGGDRDPVFPPAVLEGLEGSGGHADELEVRQVQGAGHYLHEERPDVVVDAIRELFPQDVTNVMSQIEPLVSRRSRG